MIAQLDSVTLTWSKVGELNVGRYGHNVIEVRAEFLVIGGGGRGVTETERCRFVAGQIRCTRQKPLLELYAWYPELVSVPDGYCSK